MQLIVNLSNGVIPIHKPEKKPARIPKGLVNKGWQDAKALT